MDINLILSTGALIIGVLSLIGFRIKRGRKISWKQIDKALKKIEPDIREYSPDVLVGLADGRIICAIIAANLRISEVYAIDIPIEYDNLGRRQTQIHGFVGNIEDKKVLLVDSHIYTGTNMRVALNHLREKKPKILKTAVLFKHEVGDAAQLVDMFAILIDGKRKHMPWSYTEEHQNAYLIKLSQER